MPAVLRLAVAAILGSAVAAQAFKDIECKAKVDMMISEPGAYDRVVRLVGQGKSAAARRLVKCMIPKGRGVFIVGKAKRGRESFVPVSTGDCIGETYRPHLVCPGDPKRR
jgi:hypothetical protein